MTVDTAADRQGPPLRPRLRRVRNRCLAEPGAVILLLIVATLGLPIFVLLAQILVPSADVWAHLLDTVFWRYAINSLWLALGVGLGALILGTSTAWLCSMCRFPGRRIFEWAMVLPLALPTYAIGFTYAGLLDYPGPVQTALRSWFDWQRGDYWFPEIRSLAGVVLVMSLVLFPYVYLLARNAFLTRSAAALEVGKTLGRGPWSCFFLIALPLARPALAGGVALAVMEALADYGTVQYYGVDTFTTGIFRTWFGLGDIAAASQLASLLLVLIFLVLLLERRSRGGARFHDEARSRRVTTGYRLAGGRAWAATLACGLCLLVAFVIPTAQLLAWSIATADRMIDENFARLAGQSFSLAAIAAVCGVCLALIVAYGVRFSRSPLTTTLSRLAGMGYAVPGAVIAIGALVPLAWMDNAIDGLARDWLGLSTGLLFTGGIAVLVYAYLVRFLAVALNVIESGLGRVTESMDDAARTLGAGRAKILEKIHIPLISSSLLTAGLMVFVDVMKELPATLILRPFDFNTLAVRAYELAMDERLADSASAALTIVLVGLLPVIILSRAITRARPAAAGVNP